MKNNPKTRYSEMKQTINNNIQLTLKYFEAKMYGKLQNKMWDIGGLLDQMLMTRRS